MTILDMPATHEAMSVGEPMDAFDAVDAEPVAGAQLRLIPEAARRFRRDLLASGRPDLVATRDLVSLPYPTKFGLWRAALSPSIFLCITNRLIVIRWTEPGGRRRTLLFEPTDSALAQNTPYFAALTANAVNRRFRPLVNKDLGTVTGHLAALGIAPAEVDYLVFDHLHTQDVRRLVGTTVPQPDLGGPVTATFPNAKLLVQRDELMSMIDLHPLQRPWYQPATFQDLTPSAIQPLDGTVLIGPGVAIMSTPGHTFGNQSLAVVTSTGIWVSSENTIAAEGMVPEHSKIPGVARWAKRWGQEVILNANTIELAGQQYNSMVREKHVADRAQTDSRFPQFLPSSELTAHPLFPGTAPTFTHKAMSPA